MVKQLLLSFGFSFFLFSVNAQEISKVSLQPGSSQTESNGNAISGWVGNRIAYVNTDVSNEEVSMGYGDNGVATRLSNLEASLFPNPVTEKSTLTVKGISQAYVLRIFDNQGKNITPNDIAGKSFKQSNMEVSFANLPIGYLLVEITTLDGKNGNTLKILKTN